MPATSTRASYRAVFAVREFRVMFTALLMLALGFELEILGLSVLVYARTGSAFLSAVAFGAGFLPQALSGVLLTSLADRLPPRPAISAGLLGRAVPGLAIGAAAAMPVAVMLALVAVTALGTPVFLAANSGLLPEILDGDAYPLGRSVLGLTSAGTQLLGLGLGGALLAALPPRAVLGGAGLALTAAALVVRLGLRRRPARRAGRLRDTVRATLDGNRALLARPRIRHLLLIQWLPVWFATGAEALAVPYAEATGHPASAGALLMAAVPVGMLLGNLAVGRCPPGRRERLVLPLALLNGGSLLAFALRPPLVAAAVALVISGAGLAYSIGLQRAFRDAVPPELRGQGFGLASTGLMSGQGLAPPLVGASARALGPGGAMAAAGACVVLAALAFARPGPTRLAALEG